MAAALPCQGQRDASVPTRGSPLRIKLPGSWLPFVVLIARLNMTQTRERDMVGHQQETISRCMIEKLSSHRICTLWVMVKHGLPVGMIKIKGLMMENVGGMEQLVSFRKESVLA